MGTDACQSGKFTLSDMRNHEFSGQVADSLSGEPATFATQGFNHSFYTYLLLREGVDPNELERKFPEFLEKYLGEQLRSFGVEAKPFLQPVVDIHLFSDIDVQIGANSDIMYIYIFSSMALFILLIACINFMNLSTARSAHRAQEMVFLSGDYDFMDVMGMGMASFMAEQRIKEIGVRKVLGASILDIVLLLSRDFTKLVIISFVVVAPIVYYGMNLWLQEFPYQVDLNPVMFVLAELAALIISWLTVGYQALKAAMTNPADAFQYE